MEDIGKLQKIAQMSAELRKHGIASDSQEALREAEAIYQEKTPNQFQAIPMESTEKPQQASSVGSDELLRLQNSVNDRLASVEKDVSNVIGKMNEMIKVINKLESRLEERGVPELPKEKQTTIAAPPKEEAHARSGNFTPGDVQIDKIFYFGKR